MSALHLNSTHAALLVEGKVLVHPIQVPPDHAIDDLDASLPPEGMPGPIVCLGLSQHFVITGTACGTLCYYMVDGLACVNEYRHSGKGKELLAGGDGVGGGGAILQELAGHLA